MIVAEQKPLEEIIRYLEEYKNILIAACGTCVTVCMAGGEKEARELAAVLALKARSGESDISGDPGDSGDYGDSGDGGISGDINIKVAVPKRQCDAEFLEEISDMADNADVILSMGCGAGVQYMAEKFPGKPVLPALNTKFMGVNRDVGLWTEMCQGCGDCILERTGGVCPVTRCSKSNFNGPCGGSSDGKCEIDPQTDCGWQLIYQKLKGLGKLDRLYEIIEPKDWRSSRDGGPRKVVKKDIMI